MLLLEVCASSSIQSERRKTRRLGSSLPAKTRQQASRSRRVDEQVGATQRAMQNHITKTPHHSSKAAHSPSRARQLRAVGLLLVSSSALHCCRSHSRRDRCSLLRR